MNINIKLTNLESTPSIKEYIENKVGSLDKFIQKWEKEEGSVEVKFEIARTTKHHNKGQVYFAEINIVLGGKLLHAEYYGEDIHETVDKVKDIAKNEILKLKDKQSEKKVRKSE